jgi:hypothetical protein
MTALDPRGASDNEFDSKYKRKGQFNMGNCR